MRGRVKMAAVLGLQRCRPVVLVVLTPSCCGHDKRCGAGKRRDDDERPKPQFAHVRAAVGRRCHQHAV